MLCSAYEAEAVDGGAHQDDAGHADDDAEKREEAAQFVGSKMESRPSEVALRKLIRELGRGRTPLAVLTAAINGSGYP